MPENVCNFNMLSPWEHVTQGAELGKNHLILLDRIDRIRGMSLLLITSAKLRLIVHLRRKADWPFCLSSGKAEAKKSI